MPEARHDTAPTSPPANGRYEAWPNTTVQAGLSEQPQRVSEPSVAWCAGFAAEVAFPEADSKSCESVSPGLPYMPRWTGERSGNI